MCENAFTKMSFSRGGLITGHKWCAFGSTLYDFEMIYAFSCVRFFFVVHKTLVSCVRRLLEKRLVSYNSKITWFSTQSIAMAGYGMNLMDNMNCMMYSRWCQAEAVCVNRIFVQWRVRTHWGRKCVWMDSRRIFEELASGVFFCGLFELLKSDNFHDISLWGFFRRKSVKRVKKGKIFAFLKTSTCS